MMDKTYIEVVRLLLEGAPAIFETPHFAIVAGAKTSGVAQVAPAGDVLERFARDGGISRTRMEKARERSDVPYVTFQKSGVFDRVDSSLGQRQFAPRSQEFIRVRQLGGPMPD